MPFPTLRSTSFASLLLTTILTADAAAASYRVTIHGGAQATAFAPVAFELPQSRAPGNGSWQLTDADGNAVPVQIDDTGKGWLLPGAIEAREERVFTLRRGGTTAEPAVQVREQDGVLSFRHGDLELFAYQMEKSRPPEGAREIYERGGYIYPARTPDGRLVLGDYPQAHLHHHGIWSPWTKTEFEGRTPDFWNMGAGTGTVEFVGLEKRFEGPVFAGFQAKHQFVDLSAPGGRKVALNETWTVRAFAPEADADYWVLDLESTQTTAGDSPLRLPEYHYGGLGVRGHHDWDGAANAKWLTSNGESDRVKAHATRARWCHLGGEVDGAPAGVAILGHPTNYRFPQPMRVHPSEPFFCFAPQQGGDMVIEPGQAYVTRHRFVFADGEADANLLNRLWNDYANPPRVTVELE